MKILTATEMREADRLTTERYGISGMELMERAGEGVVARLQREYPELAKRRVAVLCGKGNNGGDGFVVARLLKALGAEPSLVLFGEEKEVRGDAATNLKRWRDAGGEISSANDGKGISSALAAAANSEIIVDAMLGTGLKGAASGPISQAIETVNSRRRSARVIAVDTPSGLPSEALSAAGPVVRADWTVTFTAPKVGQLLSPDCETVGQLSVHRIGTPAGLIEEVGKSGLRWIEPSEFCRLPLKRRADSNKGTYGHVLIVAGSRGKAGAAALSGWGALRAGAGLVTVATPRDALPTVAGYLPELMTAELAQTRAGTASLANFQQKKFAKLTQGKTVIAIGPGLTTEAETQRFT
ncbi:MAG TPA: NAD(P)H-hydrate epimerase, partial [Candidatus Acidoferrales bacterium]|nr:NAD(P)H-hydrate epimerase [Candidatus Acidoferrales bacterium]